MKANGTSPSHWVLDAAERPKVAVPLMPEFAIVSTLVLIAAPIVLVGFTAVRALLKSKDRARAERAGQPDAQVRRTYVDCAGG